MITSSNHILRPQSSQTTCQQPVQGNPTGFRLERVQPWVETEGGYFCRKESGGRVKGIASQKVEV